MKYDYQRAAYVPPLFQMRALRLLEIAARDLGIPKPNLDCAEAFNGRGPLVHTSDHECAGIGAVLCV